MRVASPAIACRSACFALHGYGGHGIGLEVHDPAQYYEQGTRFGVGDVFTVEPGIYISPDLLSSLPDTPKNRAFLAKVRPAVERYKGIGVRLEDDYALTEKGLNGSRRAHLARWIGSRRSCGFGRSSCLAAAPAAGRGLPEAG